MRRILLYSSILPTIVIAVGGPVQAQPNYQPLEPGWEWFFQGTFGSQEHVSMVGEMEVYGVPTAVREVDIGGGLPQVFRNFWTVSAEGDLFLHGAENLTYPIRFAFDPPIPWLDVPLWVGKTWSHQYRVCEDFDPNQCGLLQTTNVEITFEGPVTVPAGTFPCFCQSLSADADAVPDEDRRFSVTGRYLGQAGDENGRRAVGDCYSDGVGLIQHPGLDSETYQLALWNPSTPTVEHTWAAVKHHYRR